MENQTDIMGSFVAVSPEMQKVMKSVHQIAKYPISVMLSGETGSGKGKLAEIIHFLSDRWERRFNSINCSAIPDTLLESLLFGHQKGAFTGAVETTTGLFEQSEMGPCS